MKFSKDIWMKYSVRLCESALSLLVVFLMLAATVVMTTFLTTTTRQPPNSSRNILRPVSLC